MVLQNDIAQVVLLSALSSILYSIETFVPKPFPFLRIGLGNILVLFSIVQFGILSGVFVGLVKSLLGGLISGTFFTPSTYLSIAGTLSGIIIMFLLFKLCIFGLVGISAAGAMVNTTIQIIIISSIFTGKFSFFYMTKFLLTFSMFTGIITGLLTFYLLNFYKRRGYAFTSYS